MSVSTTKQQIRTLVGALPKASEIFEIKSKSIVYLNELNLDLTKEIFLVVSGKDQVTIIDNHFIPARKQQSIKINLVTVPGVEVDYLITSPNLNSYQAIYQAYPGRDSKLNFYLLGKLSDANYYFTLAINHRFSGSVGNILSAFAFSGQSKSNVNLINNHQGRATTGDIKFKGIGYDAARALTEGMIAIGTKAQNTNSYLQQDILLVSSAAGIDAKPNLEILNNEVKASHGATLSSFDQNALFYLYSRGLNEALAAQLIIDGFFATLTVGVKNKIIVDNFKNFWRMV